VIGFERTGSGVGPPKPGENVVITPRQLKAVREQAIAILMATGLSVRQDEMDQMEVVDFGLNELERSGVQIIPLVDTHRLTVKLLIMLPNQTEPEHRHPPLGDYPGKEETIRCEWGELYLYGPGEAAPNPKAHPPDARRQTYTVWHEYILSLAIRLHFNPIRRTGSRAAQRELSFGASQPKPSMFRICSPIRMFVEKP
jgi:hypothetical protein